MLPGEGGENDNVVGNKVFMIRNKRITIFRWVSFVESRENSGNILQSVFSLKNRITRNTRR